MRIVLEVGGKQYPIYFNGQTEQYETSIEGVFVYAKTLERLRKNANKILHIRKTTLLEVKG